MFTKSKDLQLSFITYKDIDKNCKLICRWEASLKNPQQVLWIDNLEKVVIKEWILSFVWYSSGHDEIDVDKALYISIAPFKTSKPAIAPMNQAQAHEQSDYYGRERSTMDLIPDSRM